MTKQIVITVGISVVAVLVLLAAGIYLFPHKMPEVSVVSLSAATSSIAMNTTSPAQPTNNPPVVRVIEGAIYEHDYSIDIYLMGVSHNVFVAKITKQVATTTRAGTPATQFEAEVVFNIKGNVQGTITVEQEGGYVKGI